MNGYYSWTTLKMVKLALLDGQKLISNIDFKEHISTLQAENKTASCICKDKNNPKATSKNPRERVCWPWKMWKWPSQRTKIGPIILILDGIYLPFERDIFLNGGLWKPKKMPEELMNSSKPNKLSKSPKNNFFDPKNGRITVTIFGKSINFWLYMWKIMLILVNPQNEYRLKHRF